MDHIFFATVPKGLESLLAGELRRLGARDLRQTTAGVGFTGTLETGYRVCLWSRLASRVLLPLTTRPAESADDVYAAAAAVDWRQHLDLESTFAVDFTGLSKGIRDTQFGAVRVKDALADQFRERYGGRRPSVDVRAPNVRIGAHLARGRLTLSLDLSGDSLHRRGYRTDRTSVAAPLKENLAAAVLVYGEWPRTASAGGGFLDPLCGSATLPIEAAWIAADVAPGLLRAERGAGFGFSRWRNHEQGVWQALLDEARERRADGMQRQRRDREQALILGSDRDPRALTIASACLERAGVETLVTLQRAELSAARPSSARGLLATNAPYGERLGDREQADTVYRELGHVLRERFTGWHAAVLAGNENQVRLLDLPTNRETSLFNGPLPCRLAFMSLAGGEHAATRSARAAVRTSSALRPPVAATSESRPPSDASPQRPRAERLLGSGAEQFANRLRKNKRHMSRQLRREDINCYRLYDADLPEYNLVVDVYGDWACVQEYAAPAEIDPVKTSRRLADALAAISAVLELPAERIVLKQRRRQRGAGQYERRGSGSDFHSVAEDGLAYLVNLTDYLDTGLFLDQRTTRRLVRRLAGGARFLNLFAYTGTMTVNAIAGGARLTASVDLSATYLHWAQRNLAANGVHATLELAGPSDPPSSPHRLVQADCLKWIAESESQYDLIWLDPPTFSNSKRMGRATFDVQRDHADLIRMTARRLLSPDGVLLFATNRRGFKLALDELPELQIKDLSQATLPFDCRRAASRHHVFQVERGRRERGRP